MIDVLERRHVRAALIERWHGDRPAFAATYCVPEQNHQLDIGVVGSRGLFGLELRGNPVRPFWANPGLPPQL
jgi:hypothetical protein